MRASFGADERRAYAMGVEKGESKVDERALASIAESMAAFLGGLNSIREAQTKAAPAEPLIAVNVCLMDVKLGRYVKPAGVFATIRLPAVPRKGDMVSVGGEQFAVRVVHFLDKPVRTEHLPQVILWVVGR